jgi:hypothetical protein
MGPNASCLAAAALLVLAFGCGDQARGTGQRAQPSTEFARVQVARAELAAARETLDRAQAGPRGASADADALRRAQSAYGAAYERYQKVLAAYLTVALNERPANPETLEALGLYADAAVSNARVLLDRGGDASRALEVLEGAERPFRAMGVPVPRDLAATLELARRVQANPPTATPAPRPRDAAAASRRQRRPARSRR